jgi:hypothetical protein
VISRLLVPPLALLLSLTPAVAGDWRDALEAMPMTNRSVLLNRSNAISLLVESFSPNSMVKALVVLPGVTDDFYLINRDQPSLNIRAINLLEAVTALTNRTAVRATFLAPFLLLHLDRDVLDPAVDIQHSPTAERLACSRSLAHAMFFDKPWNVSRSALEQNIRLTVKPSSSSDKGGHVYRVNLAGWHLTDRELLTAVAVASRTGFTIQRNRVLFESISRLSRGD